MKNIQKTIILILALFSFIPVYSQQGNILRGRVIDKANKEPLPGVTIGERDKENRVVGGIITDPDGNFIYQVKDIADTVKASFIGYTTQVIQKDFSKPITIEMAATSVEVGEITVKAEAQNTNSLTNVADRDNASSSVKVDLVQMQDVGISSAAEALQGKVSGLDIVSTSGAPGSGANIVIRGASSLSGSQPLIVIDGVPQQKFQGDLSTATEEDISSVINVPINDIKSITVLKDAASTSIYGSQGADGVLLIETQKGRMGKVQFNYIYKSTFEINPKPIPMLNGDEYIMLQLEEWHNAYGVYDVPEEIAYDPNYSDFYNYSANTDWVGAVTRNGFRNEHTFTVSGGGEKTRYYTSFDYMNDVGTTIGEGEQDFSNRINLDYLLSTKLRFSIQFAYTRRNTKRSFYNNVLSMAYQKAPNMTIWQLDENGHPTGEYFSPINSYQGSGSSYWNPVAVADLSSNNAIYNTLNNQFTLNYMINKLISFNENLSLVYTGGKSEAFLPYNAIGQDWLSWNVNIAQEDNNVSSQIRTTSQFNFNNFFRSKDHYFSGSASWITTQSHYGSMNTQSNKIPSVNIQDPAIDGQINWISNSLSERRELQLVLDANYKYKDRYIFNADINEDASTLFGSNNRWGLFWGAKFGWRFSSEPFLKSLDWLGESMLKFNMGAAGRQPSDPYARFATYASSTNYILNPAIVPNSVELDNLKWPELFNYDIRGEFTLFKGDLFTFSVDYYHRRTRDLLFGGYSIPTSSGFSSLSYLNGGELINAGWEFESDKIQVVNKKDFNLSFFVNATTNKNEFTALPPNYNTERDVSVGNKTYPKRVALGQPIGSFFGFKYLGVWPSDASVVATDASGNPLVDAEGAPVPFSYLGTYNFKGGDARYADINHDGKIDLNDVVYIGDSNPKYFGGFGTNVRYKNFVFMCSFDFRAGFDIVNMTAMNTQGMNDRNNQSKAVLSRWRVEGQNEPGMLPRAYLNNPANNLGSDRYVERGDFMRLNTVKLSYRFNREFCNKLGIRSANFTLSAIRLFTLTNYSGQNPEVGTVSTDPFWIGVDNSRTPPTQQISFTFNVGF